MEGAALPKCLPFSFPQSRILDLSGLDVFACQTVSVGGVGKQPQIMHSIWRVINNLLVHSCSCECVKGSVSPLTKEQPLQKDGNVILSLYLTELHLQSWHFSLSLLGMICTKCSQLQLIWLISLLLCWGTCGEPGQQNDPQSMLHLFWLPRGTGFSISQNWRSSLLHEAETLRSILEYNDEL